MCTHTCTCTTTGTLHRVIGLRARPFSITTPCRQPQPKQMSWLIILEVSCCLTTCHEPGSCRLNKTSVVESDVHMMWHLICVCIAKYVKLDIIATSFSPKQHDTGWNRYHRASGYNISDLVRFWCEPTFARLNMWKQHGRSLHAEAMYNTLLTLRSPLILMLSIGFDCNLT